MKTTIERGALLKSLNHVQSVVERRNTIPILSNVLLEAKDGALSLTATDLDIEIIETIPAEIGRAGATTAPAHTLYDIVRKLPDGAQVELDYSEADGRLGLNAGRSKFQLSCLPRDDFPTMTAGDMPNQFVVESKDLSRLIDKTRFAISTEETRYYLNGIYLHATDSNEKPTLRAVATDGHRLARFELSLPEGAAGMPGVIIPRKAVAEVRKLVDDLEGAVEVALSDTKIRFEIADVTLTSKLIDGTFPDYARVIPTGNDKILTVQSKDFATAVDRVSTIALEKTRAVKLNLEKEQLTLSVVNPDTGDATEQLHVDYASDPMEIGFNARYLLDITSQLDGADAQFVLADPGSPTIVKDTQDEAALYVLMPMRV
jgi:DNA polymerase-3 subunit beta